VHANLQLLFPSGYQSRGNYEWLLHTRLHIMHTFTDTLGFFQSAKELLDKT